MRVVLNRSGPLAVALSGVALTVLMVLIDDRRLAAKPDDPMLEYGALGMTAWWILGTSCATGLGWQALRSWRRSRKAFAALAYVVIWLAVGSALARTSPTTSSDQVSSRFPARASRNRWIASARPARTARS